MVTVLNGGARTPAVKRLTSLGPASAPTKRAASNGGNHDARVSTEPLLTGAVNEAELPAAPPEAKRKPTSPLLEIAFDESLPTWGWYALESFPWGSMRWSGPETDSYTLLNLPQDIPIILSIHVIDFAHPTIFDEIRISVDGRALPVRRQRQGKAAIFSVAVAPRLKNRHSATELAIRVPRLHRPGTKSGVEQERLLGMAVTKFVVEHDLSRVISCAG